VLRKHGVSFYAYSPLAMGMLAGGKQKESLEAAQTLPPGSRYVLLCTLPADVRFHPESRKGVNFQKSWFKQENFEAVKILNRTATESGIAPTALSLRWLAHVSTPLCFKLTSVALRLEGRAGRWNHPWGIFDKTAPGDCVSLLGRPAGGDTSPGFRAYVGDLQGCCAEVTGLIRYSIDACRDPESTGARVSGHTTCIMRGECRLDTGDM
jgi:hypothetical protein